MNSSVRICSCSTRCLCSSLWCPSCAKVALSAVFRRRKENPARKTLATLVTKPRVVAGRRCPTDGADREMARRDEGCHERVQLIKNKTWAHWAKQESVYIGVYMKWSHRYPNLVFFVYFALFPLLYFLCFVSLAMFPLFRFICCCSLSFVSFALFPYLCSLCFVSWILFPLLCFLSLVAFALFP